MADPYRAARRRIFLRTAGCVNRAKTTLARARQFLGAASAVSIAFGLAIIVIAIVALSARAYQEGLQPEREIERYQQYGSAVQSIREQFKEADSPRRKLAVMRRMEHVAFSEMRNFLIAMERSSFAM
jgi:hypothetical protein